jgi:para-nitrobenzyl esterase
MTEVRTAAGTVRGRWEDGLAVFRGIPFAAPPVGAARFAAPQPVPRWDGVREAFDFGPTVPQDLAGFRPAGAEPPPPASYDWLTVNVWTPAPGPAERRPVMVWIHGGAYKLGSSSQAGYDARRIARDGDLVVVSCNYRVGIEGFAEIDGAPANRALLDQVAALEWVRDNITAFGGDPDRVTVFGESAGGGTIAALLAMPAATGLFRRAIAQSVPGTFQSAELAADVTAAIAAERGLRPTVADLSAVEPHELVLAGEAVAKTARQHLSRWGVLAQQTDTLYAPVVDGEVLSTTPWQALANGAARDVDLITGHNREECRLFLGMFGKLGKITDEDAAWALRVYAPEPDAYRTAFPSASAEELYERVQSDWLFRMPTLRLAQAQSAGGGRAYLYELTWPAPGAGGRFGACHGLDLPLLFGTTDADLGPLLLGPEPPAETERLSTQFRTAWTSFATTGDPGWPAFDDEHRLTQIFDSTPEVTPYPEETSRQLWQNHDFGPLPLLSGE